MNLTLPDALAPQLKIVLTEEVELYERLCRMRHITEAERQLLKMRGAMLADLLGQLVIGHG